MEYTVKFKKIPEFQLTKADVEFEVFFNGSKLGTLEVSEGSLEWITNNNSKKHKVAWKKFDELMKQNVPLKS
jgi:hypothetical protein